MNTLFKIFSDHEDGLIRRFHQHPFFRNFEKLTDQELKNFLKQKWFISETFVPAYDKAVNALSDEESKKVLKKIIADESAAGFPSHREDLLADLEYIGVKRQEVLTTKPNKETLKYISGINEIVKYSNDNDHDLKVMSALRTASEILAAEEYRHVVPALEKRYHLTPEKSRFYAPHFYHDRKDSETGQHSHSFESVLERIISDEKKLNIATESADKAFKIRSNLYNQFTPSYSIKKVARNSGGAFIAAAGIALIFGNLKDERKDYIKFLNSLEPEARAFYVDADKRVLDKYVRSGNKNYLKMAGTFTAVKEEWGEQ